MVRVPPEEPCGSVVVAVGINDSKFHEISQSNVQRLTSNVRHSSEPALSLSKGLELRVESRREYSSAHVHKNIPCPLSPVYKREGVKK